MSSVNPSFLLPPVEYRHPPRKRTEGRYKHRQPESSANPSPATTDTHPEWARKYAIKGRLTSRSEQVAAAKPSAILRASTRREPQPPVPSGYFVAIPNRPPALLGLDNEKS